MTMSDIIIQFIITMIIGIPILFAIDWLLTSDL